MVGENVALKTVERVFVLAADLPGNLELARSVLQSGRASSPLCDFSPEEWGSAEQRSALTVRDLLRQMWHRTATCMGGGLANALA